MALKTDVAGTNSYSREWLLAEFHPALSRQSVTLISGQNLKRGAVLGKITVGGKYTQVNLGASDGSQTAVAVLAEDCDASGGDTTCSVIYQLAVFNAGELIYPSGASAANKTTIRTALKAVNLGTVSGV